MKLTYRGVGYDCDPPSIDMMEAGIGGMYRGCSWQARYPRHIPVPQPVRDLKYRGVAYRTGEMTESRVPASMPASVPARAPARESMPAMPVREAPIYIRDRALKNEVAKVHFANLCRNLEMRLQAAESRGDDALVKLLEKESQELTCSLG